MEETRPGSIVVGGLKLKWHELAAPDSGDCGRGFGLWVVDDPDALLDHITEAEYYANDERMPYFGTIWPAAESLAAKVLAGPPLDGMRVLDLGCGLGACGLAAARRGARVTFLDWEPRSLKIVEANARAQVPPLPSIERVVADWRKPPPMEPFDLVLGADVLYEQRNGPAVAAFLARHLAVGAEAWISDPGRLHSRSFPSLAQQAGLEFLGGEILPPMAHRRDVTLLRLRRAS